MALLHTDIQGEGLQPSQYHQCALSIGNCHETSARMHANQAQTAARNADFARGSATKQNQRVSSCNSYCATTGLLIHSKGRSCSRLSHICEYLPKRVIGADNHQKAFISKPTVVSSENNLSGYPFKRVRVSSLIEKPETHPDVYCASVARAERLTYTFNTYSPHHRPSTATQKDKMLAGGEFLPSHEQLVHDRDRCNTALWHFNNSHPRSQSLFLDILMLQCSVGENCFVTPPFACDYGYNITIGQDVIIDRNCTILDCVLVKIGDRCVIGPNVSKWSLVTII